MKKLLPLVLVLSSAVAAAPVKVATVEGISEYKLANGLRVLIFPDDSKPWVTVNVTYFVGSRHEGYGETGMAHLLEHMMFKGSKTYPHVLEQLESRGARMNGTTSDDRTNYFETLKAEKDNLAFALTLEADRMVNAKIAPEDLKTEFSVVRNEFEIGENYPDAVLRERMMHAAYEWHNYGKSTIGSKSDIERVPATTLRTFYQRYYQPDNAMLVVAGKIDPAATLALVDKTFGKIPRPKRVLPATYTVEPVQDGERTVTLRRPGDVQEVGLVYHALPGAHPDYVAEDAIVGILTDQPSGRLYKALVEPGLAAKVKGESSPTREPGVIFLMTEVRKDKPLDQVRDKMISAVEGLAQGKISDEEVERWRAQALREIDLGLTNPETLGIELSEWAAQGDWRMKFIYRERVRALKAADVQRVAAQFLKQSNRTVGEFLVTAKPDRAPLPDAPDVNAYVAAYNDHGALESGEAFASTVDEIEKRTQRTTLASGFQLALLPKKTRGGAVEIVLHLRAGTEKDLKGKMTVAQMLRGMVLRGTKKHSYQQIQDELARLKADLKPSMGAFGGADGASFHLTTVRESVPAVLALLAEIVHEPSFDAGEFERLRKEMLADIEQQLQQPMALGFTALQQKIMPFPKDDPRYMPSLPERVERIKAVKLEQLAQFHQRFWGAGGGSLVLVGDFDVKAVKQVADAQFGNWNAPTPWQRMPIPYQAAHPSDEVVRTVDKAMALVGAALAVQMRDDDPDYAALRFADYIYGGGMHSRIWGRLREKEGLSYGTFSFLNASAHDQSGIFFAMAMCAPQNAGKAMTGLVEEMKKLVSDGIKDSELAQQKQAFQASFDTELGDDANLVEVLDRGHNDGHTLDFDAALNKRVQGLKAADTVAAFKKWLNVDGLAKVRVGDLPN